jgi:3-oxoadipate enol-lactonase
MIAYLNGVNIAFSDQGKGDPLIFLHAFPLNRSMWDPQVQALVKRYRIVTVDLRGHGESDAPLWRYTMEQFSDDLNALLDHLSIPHATWIGLSMGGYILFALWRKYPRLINALVLADTKASADSPEGKAGRFTMAQTAYTEGPTAIADIMIPKLLSPSSVETRHDLVTHLRQMITRNHVSGIVGDLMAMEERPDSLSLLPNIQCPTLVIVGEHDVATPPSEAQLMADHIPNSSLAIIPQAGHVSNMENPEAFNQALKTFLSSL